MKKRILSILLTVCLLMALLPTVAFAEGSVTYLDADGTLKTSPSATEVTSSDTGWGTSGTTTWYVVQGTVIIGSRVTVSGDVRLILADGCTLTVNGGIQVQDDDDDITNGSANALTIYAQSTDESTMGKLIAKGAERDYNAVIGGNEGNGYGGSGGAITINGGVVKATNTDGAGIGGGYGSDSGGSGGTITINGGNINASSQFGAGIGGGEGVDDGGSGGEITINGGSVIATGVNGAGIGGGQGDGGGQGGGSGGTITINGGSVIATGVNGAAIGGGYSGGGTGGDGGTITITGGSVIATGNVNGAGIGSGYGTRGGSGGEVMITGGTVKASSSRGAGIGVGYSDSEIGNSGTFQTNNGNAVIFASSIGDQSGKTSNAWHGIIFEGDEGKVYGNPTLADDLTIPENKALDIPSGNTLTVNSKITVQGTLTNNGKIYVDGTFTGTADNLYYPLTITNATGSGDISEYNSKTYGKAGGKITLTPDTPPTGYSFDKWVVLPSSVTVNANNSFTMPSTPLELTAQWKDIENPVITGIENDRTYCAEVEFEASDNDGRPAENNPNTGATVPQTGDNSNMALWMAVLLVSGGLLTVTVIKGVETEQKRRK